MKIANLGFASLLFILCFSHNACGQEDSSDVEQKNISIELYRELKSDFKDFKADTSKNVTHEVTAAREDIKTFVLEHFLYFLAGAFAFMTGSGYMIYSIVKKQLDAASKVLVAQHSKTIHDELVESILDVNGQSLFHWWRFYDELLPESKGEYQIMVTVLCKRTFNLINKIDNITYDSRVFVDYMTNALYFLADVDDRELLAERKPLVRSVFKRFENLLLDVPQLQRDADWAERMECVCYAIYKYKLRRHRTVKQYLKEVLSYLPPNSLKELQESYPKIDLTT